MSFAEKALVGYALRHADGVALPGLDVRLTAISAGRVVYRSSAVTASDGSFELALSNLTGVRYRIRFETAGEPLDSAGKATFVPGTVPARGTVFRVVAPAPSQLVGDAAPSVPVASASVRGLITHQNGQRVDGATVRVYSWTPGVETLLDEVTTDSDGAYTATYTYPGTPPDVFVVVVDATEAECGRSAVTYGAPNHLRLDVEVIGDSLWGPSAYARLDDVLAGPLTGATLDELDIEDFDRLAEKFGLTARQVESYVRAGAFAETLTPDAESLFGIVSTLRAGTASLVATVSGADLQGTLAAAGDRHLVSAAVAAAAETTAGELFVDAVALLLDDETEGSLGALLTAAAPGLDAAQRELLAADWLQNPNSPSAFWDAVAAHTEFDAGDVAAAKRAVALSMVAYDHLPLVKAWLAAYSGAAADQAAAVTLTEWRDLLDEEVESSEVGTPDWVEGDTEDERRVTFARLVFARAEQAWPSRAVALGYRGADPGDTTDLSKFLRDNPTFDFARARIKAFLDDPGTNLTAVSDVPALRTRLRLLQRLFRAVPPPGRFTAVMALEDAGFKSAAGVARTGVRRFVTNFATALGDTERARAVWARARHIADRAAHYYMRFATWQRSEVARARAPSYSLAASQIEGFSEIFGADSCACATCLTVTSPAAYFVDLLHWLWGMNGPGPSPAYTDLTTRRPELPLLELSCANSDTLLPYVDLAIEVLEVAVCNNSPAEDAALPVRTTRTTDELVAQPEYELADAYGVLKVAPWPFLLPYHHDLTQVRLSLDFVGATAVDLLELYGDDTLTEDQVSIVRVGGSAALAVLLQQQDPEQPEVNWGYPVDTTTVDHPNPDLTAMVHWTVALRWVPEFIARAQLEGGDVGEQVQDLLHARFVQTPNAFELATAVTPSCSLEDYYLGEVFPEEGESSAVPGPDEFTRLATFVRLMRLTGWSALDVDKALWAFGVVPSADQSGLTAAQLRSFGYLHRIRGHLPKVELDRILSWWSKSGGVYVIDTFLDRASKAKPVRPLYDRLFLDPALVADPSSSNFALASGRLALASDGANLVAENQSYLLAAFETTADELADAAAVVEAQLDPEDAPLARTMDNISRLYRVLSTAQASDLTVRQADAFKHAFEEPPYESPEAATLWFGGLAELRDLNLTVAEVLYVCAHDEDAVAEVGPSESTTREFLGALRDELRAVNAGDVTTVDDAMLASLLTPLVPGDVSVVTLVAVVAGTDADDTHEALLRDSLSAYLGDDAINTAAPALELAEALNPAVPDQAAQMDGRRVAFFTALSIALGRQAAIVRAVSEAFSLAEAVVSPVCDLAFTALGPSRPLDVWTSDTFIGNAEDDDPADPWGDLTPADHADAFKAHDLINKVCLLLAAWKTRPEMVELWLGHVGADPDLSLLDLASLPEAEDLGGFRVRYEALRTAGKLQRLTADAAWPGALADLQAGQVATFVASASTVLGLGQESTDAFVLGRGTGRVVLGPVGDLGASSAAIDVLVNEGPEVSVIPPWDDTDAALRALQTAFEAAYPEDGDPVAVCLTEAGEPAGELGVAAKLRIDPGTQSVDVSSSTLVVEAPELFDVEELDRLARAVRLAEQVGASPTDMFGWATVNPDVTVTSGIRQAIRSKYTSTGSWSAAWHPVRDKLRKVQQAALRAWVHAFVESVPDLGFHLIDAKMDPLIMTTRLVMGISAVQQYVQRLLLGVDPETTLTDDQRLALAEDWEWMSTYRVWEAARKVFLYPELYAEPELRIGKTPLFERLESSIQSAPVTDASVTSAATAYADALLTLANPQVAGMCRELADDDGGKHRKKDHTLHIFAQTRTDPPLTYYRRFEKMSVWTPWEPVELAINSRVLCPVVFNSRLVVFWLNATVTDDTAENRSDADVSVSWATYTDGAWQPAERGPSKRAEDVAAHDGEIVEKRWTLYAVQQGRNRLNVQVVQSAGNQAHLEEIFAEWELDANTWELVASTPNTKEREVLDALDAMADSQGYRVWHEGEEHPALNSTLYMPVNGGRHGVDNAVYDDEYAEVLQINEANRAMTVRVPRTDNVFTSQEPYCVQDAERGYLLELKDSTKIDGSNPNILANARVASGDTFKVVAQITARNMHHPYAYLISSALHRDGVDGLLNPDPNSEDFGTGELLFQEKTDLDLEGDSTFVNVYATDNIIPVADDALPLDEFEFGTGSAFGVYNWEMFFHVSMYLAQRLREEGLFEDALRWVQYVFDPRLEPDKQWRVKPLRDASDDAIDEWLAAADTENSGLDKEFSDQVDAWRSDPFDPHLIAQMRPEAYKRLAILRYLDIVLDWADSSFSQDTRESINRAYQLYLYGLGVLGDRPQTIAADVAVPEVQTFSSLLDDLDEFSNAFVGLENATPYAADDNASSIARGDFWSPTSFYFCVPRNDAIDMYWDRIEDRIYKIRNSMNIDGVVRTLPLFPPPINPALLVAAAASGADLGSVANARSAAPMYRFPTMLARAKELAGVVSQLGGALLAAIEKRDGEEVARLREDQELEMAELTVSTKQLQLDEANASLEAAKQAKAVVEQRGDYYQRLLDNPVLPAEALADQDFKKVGAGSMLAAQGQTLASSLALVPDVHGVAPVFGGSFLSRAASAAAAGIGIFVAKDSHSQSKHERDGSRRRRQQDWTQQVASAKKELVQHDALIDAAQIRVDIATSEIDNQRRQVAHARDRNDLLKAKFTNKELYSWMVGSVAQVHFQAYQMALEVARQAEASYRYELAVPNEKPPFVRWTNWDGLRKGLHAGERLSFDLHRLERAYNEGDVRELQITKTISLAQVDPVALLMLRETKACQFELAEFLFDMDFPGHYLRRIKGVSISMPCVVGPSGGVNATVRLQGSKTRVMAVQADPLVEDPSFDAIAVSGAQDETGVFNFNLDSARLMPFERRGVVGHWSIDITSNYPSIDPRSISDVILRVQYTARDGGALLAADANAAVAEVLAAIPVPPLDPPVVLQRVFSAKRDFPDAWHVLLNPEGGSGSDAVLAFSLERDHFPAPFGSATVTLGAYEVGITAGPSASGATPPVSATIGLGTSATSSRDLGTDNELYALSVAVSAGTSNTLNTANPARTFSMAIAAAELLTTGLTNEDDLLDPEMIDDVYLVVTYTVSG